MRMAWPFCLVKVKGQTCTRMHFTRAHWKKRKSTTRDAVVVNLHYLHSLFHLGMCCYEVIYNRWIMNSNEEFMTNPPTPPHPTHPPKRKVESPRTQIWSMHACRARYRAEGCTYGYSPALRRGTALYPTVLRCYWAGGPVEQRRCGKAACILVPNG